MNCRTECIREETQQFGAWLMIRNNRSAWRHRGVLFKDESMGQIRKRGAFYQIRYYRNGQRLEARTVKR